MKPFSEIWAAMILKNSKLLNREAVLTITVGQFRRALEQAFDKGVAAERAEKKPSDFMGGLFG